MKSYYFGTICIRHFVYAFDIIIKYAFFWNFIIVTFTFGEIEFLINIENEIIEALRPPWIQGLSVLGGEPCEEENERVLIPFLKREKMECPNSDTWLFSGYTYEMLQGSEILQYVDVLVDGPFLIDQKDISLQFRGSRNQRILRLKGGRPI